MVDQRKVMKSINVNFDNNKCPGLNKVAKRDNQALRFKKSRLSRGFWGRG